MYTRIVILSKKNFTPFEVKKLLETLPVNQRLKLLVIFFPDAINPYLCFPSDNQATVPTTSNLEYWMKINQITKCEKVLSESATGSNNCTIEHIHLN